MQTCCCTLARNPARPRGASEQRCGPTPVDSMVAAVARHGLAGTCTPLQACATSMFHTFGSMHVLCYVSTWPLTVFLLTCLMPVPTCLESLWLSLTLLRTVLYPVRSRLTPSWAVLFCPGTLSYTWLVCLTPCWMLSYIFRGCLILSGRLYVLRFVCASYEASKALLFGTSICSQSRLPKLYNVLNPDYPDSPDYHNVPAWEPAIQKNMASLRIPQDPRQNRIPKGHVKDVLFVIPDSSLNSTMACLSY